ncbi:MAG: ribose-phosphate pyrophosphokinase [Lachnospiraceae bacterium]|nr:ribose-phosphate pyrophosphokinase [Lachnospiraceae bacterium]
MAFPLTVNGVKHIQAAPLGVICMDSFKEQGKKVDERLLKLYTQIDPEALPNKETFMINAKCPRFQNGDAKGIINESVRGLDLYIVSDVGNYNCQYNMFGQTVPMSPDDHWADIKRIIQAASGKAYRITVVMPNMYGARQHRRAFRESLDCAYALQELQAMGVDGVITFDAHDPRVCNAIPLMGFDNLMPSYQILKALVEHQPDLKLDKENFMVVSPDEGAISRNVFYASELGVDMGMYYKRRDYSTIVDGHNPIVAHEFLGSDLQGKDVFVYDDMIASGESMLDLAYDLKSRGARRLFAGCTYSLFTKGIEKFQKAYEEGVISAVISTNLTYLRPELRMAPWFYEADLTKYIAYFIAAMNHDVSVGQFLDPHKKIQKLLDEHRDSRKETQLDLFD